MDVSGWLVRNNVLMAASHERLPKNAHLAMSQVHYDFAPFQTACGFPLFVGLPRTKNILDVTCLACLRFMAKSAMTEADYVRTLLVEARAQADMARSMASAPVVHSQKSLSENLCGPIGFDASNTTTLRNVTCPHCLHALVEQHKAGADKLRQAIITHRGQRGDDRCWMDDQVLYEALGDGVEADNHVGDKFQMLRNCARYIDRRCAGGLWPTYQELEGLLVKCLAEIKLAEEGIYRYHADMDLLERLEEVVRQAKEKT